MAYRVGLQAINPPPEAVTWRWLFRVGYKDYDARGNIDEILVIDVPSLPGFIAYVGAFDAAGNSIYAFQSLDPVGLIPYFEPAWLDEPGVYTCDMSGPPVIQFLTQFPAVPPEEAERPVWPWIVGGVAATSVLALIARGRK